MAAVTICSDFGAWWASIYGVAQSQTRLKRLSSSSTDRGLELSGSRLSQRARWVLAVVILIITITIVTPVGPVTILRVQRKA